MTIRELDDLIHRVLSGGPSSADIIHKQADGKCTLYVVQMALRVQCRLGRVREVGDGPTIFELVQN